MYCGTKARSWSWSCHSGLDLDFDLVSFDLGLGLVSFDLGLGLVVLALVSVLRIWSCSHDWKEVGECVQTALD